MVEVLLLTGQSLHRGTSTALLCSSPNKLQMFCNFFFWLCAVPVSRLNPPLYC